MGCETIKKKRKKQGRMWLEERGLPEQTGLRVTWMSFINRAKDRGEGNRLGEKEKQGEAKKKAGAARGQGGQVRRQNKLGYGDPRLAPS